MKILILGAAGKIAGMVTDLLLRETDAELVLYARQASSRIKLTDPNRETLVDGAFNEQDNLLKAMEGVDIVYLNDMTDPADMQVIVKAMQATGVRRIIGATILGIYGEVAGAFGKWNEQMVTQERIRIKAIAADVIESSDLNYTLLRLTWLYNQPANENYSLTRKGEPFVGAQVTRQAVARLVMDIIQCNDDTYSRQSLGVSEPNTNWNRPSFY